MVLRDILVVETLTGSVSEDCTRICPCENDSIVVSTSIEPEASSITYKEKLVRSTYNI